MEPQRKRLRFADENDIIEDDVMGAHLDEENEGEIIDNVNVDGEDIDLDGATSRDSNMAGLDENNRGEECGEVVMKEGEEGAMNEVEKDDDGVKIDEDREDIELEEPAEVEEEEDDILNLLPYLLGLNQPQDEAFDERESLCSTVVLDGSLSPGSDATQDYLSDESGYDVDE